MSAETIKIQKSKKLKKGDRITIKGQEYEVEDFKDVRSDDQPKKMELKRIVLKKVGGIGDLKSKYAAVYDEKTGEIKLYRETEERNIEQSKYGNKFEYKSEKTFFVRK